jgi:hypothetical protein
MEMLSLAKPSRDPFRRIEGIVNMEDPMKAIEMLIKGMRGEWPNSQTAPAHYHVAIRNTAIVLLIGLTGFRRLTVSKLNYTGDDSGQLFLSGDKYTLKVPRNFFKEEDSPFFGPKHAQNDYFMEMPNVYGFNEIMTLYLNTSRPWLLENCQPHCIDNPLFIASRRGKTARVTDTLISVVYSEATEAHLAENKLRGTGIPNVSRHRPHSARHIRGTAAVKKTGSFQVAADANHNSERMARNHYARFSSKDRNGRVNETLFGVD